MSVLEDNSSQKRRQILAGAAVVFTDDGYEGASMSRIASEANVSKGTLYNYFESKSALFAAFVSQKADDEFPRLFAPISSEGSMEEVLREIAAGMIRLIISPGSLLLYRIVIAESGKFPHLAEIFWEGGPQATLNRMAEWLRQRMEAGLLRRDDPLFAAGQFFALCQTPTCMRWRLRIGDEPTREEQGRIAQGAVRVFLDSYAVRRGNDGTPT
ncbi:TetR/AcrR family transcriptional regulator [Acetobacteraceae bacterium KSS8]|uniref:TetR/AcrR family transcriptional regulator n=1 Tax=Endosaccharibacter trunci TaxID=2812733 RepID=A0ABT1W8Y2_9PROT|nr:TetR/AcrR family transcriptional regulator [Acetobacteraceae bacterium KSS8]